MSPLDTDSEAIKGALDDFFRAMDLRTDRNVRVAKRVTAMLRVGMIGMALFAGLMTWMIWVFTERAQEMTAVFSTIRGELTRMADNMTTMRHTLVDIDRDIGSFPVVTHEMGSMRVTIAAMNGDVTRLAERISRMNGNLDVITGSVSHMGQSFRLLSPAVAGIGASVAQGSKPMRTFNNLFPFSGFLP
jgi:hypothetical protein